MVFRGPEPGEQPILLRTDAGSMTFFAERTTICSGARPIVHSPLWIPLDVRQVFGNNLNRVLSGKFAWSGSFSLVKPEVATRGFLF